MDPRTAEGVPLGQRLGLPFKVDLDAARARAVAHLAAGLLTPGDVRSAGSITSIKATYVPARRVVAEAVSNWTAESGSPSGKQINWTAVSGQHRGAWSGPPQLVGPGPWAASAQQALRGGDAPVPVEALPLDGVNLVEATETLQESMRKARLWVESEESRACTQMIPGSRKRNLKLNTTIEKLALDEILVPVYAGTFQYGGKSIPFHVDGVRGVVSAPRPMSAQRVLVGLGSLAAIGVVSFVTLILLGQSAQRQECESAVSAVTSAASAGDLEQAGVALERAEQKCPPAVGEDATVALAGAREAVEAERKRQEQVLRDGATAAFDTVATELAAIDAQIAAHDHTGAEAAIDHASAALDPFTSLQPAPDRLAPLQVGLNDRRAHVEALTALADGAEQARSKSYLAADEAYAAGQNALEKDLSAEYAASKPVVALKAELTQARKRVAKGAESERRQQAKAAAEAEREKQEAEALLQVCGEKPIPDGWDGGLIAVERYMKDNAHDPSSIDVMECTMPVLTKACWKTSCKVRGNNAFGAQVVNRQTFYLGRHPTVPSLGMVLAVE